MQHAQDIRDKAVDKVAKDAPPDDMGASRSAAESRFADIPDLFQPYTEIPTPGSFDRLITSMDKAINKLSTGESADDPIKHRSYLANTNLSKVPGISDTIHDWSGEAAREFNENFVSRFIMTATNQFVVARILGSALETEKDLWARAQHDIDQIAHHTLNLLDSMDDCGKNEWKTGLTVAGALASLLGAAVTGGASAPFTVAAVGATITSTSLSISGESPDAVIASMHQAVSQLTREITHVEGRIAKTVNDTLKLIHGSRKADIVAKRPALANATYGNVKSRRYMGYAS